jgi:hypothetical protein
MPISGLIFCVEMKHFPPWSQFSRRFISSRHSAHSLSEQPQYRSGAENTDLSDRQSQASYNFAMSSVARFAAHARDLHAITWRCLSDIPCQNIFSLRLLSRPVGIQHGRRMRPVGVLEKGSRKNYTFCAGILFARCNRNRSN